MAACREEDVENIISLDKSSGRQILAQVLRLKEYNEEKDLRAAIYIDYIYDNISYCAERGLPMSQIVYVAKFAQDFLKQCLGKSLSYGVQLYKSSSEDLASVLGVRNFKVYTDFVFSTLFSHYQLFTYVFTRPRTGNIPHLSVDVNVPMPPEELNTGKVQPVWQYEKQIGDLEDKEMKLVTERVLQKEDKMSGAVLQEKDIKEKVASLSQDDFTKENLAELVRDVLHTYTTSTAESLKSSVQEAGEDLELMFQKTSVPRPQALGPPPRYKLKQPITPHTKSAGKSRQNKSRDSARSHRDGHSPRSQKTK